MKRNEKIQSQIVSVDKEKTFNGFSIYYYSRPYVAYSNGTKLSYTLVSELNALGYKAYNVCPEGLGNDLLSCYQKQTIDLTKERISLTSDDIVIYPEEISDNPLHAQNCVRYLLNTPISLTGKPIQYGLTDYLLSYSKVINDQLPQLFILEDERVLFSELRKIPKEDLVVFYFGKTEMDKLSGQVDIIMRYAACIPGKKTIITRFYPKKHRETMELLAKAKLLISFDGLTNLNYEATLLGTPVVLTSNPYHLDFLHFNVPLYGEYNSFEEYQKAQSRDSVEKAYPLYSGILDKQRQTIADAFQVITEHFSRIQTDAQYAKTITQRNLKQEDLDWAKEKSLQDIQVESIFFVQQVPRKIRKICGQDSFVYYLFPKRWKTILTKLKVFGIAKKVYRCCKH